MSTATLAPEARRNVALFTTFSVAGATRKYRKQNAEGQTVLVLESVPVFRSGTFRDSMGIQHAWEDMHMQQMVDNFNHLLKTGIMAGVPVRKGHPGFFTSGSEIMDSLIGWHTSLSTEERVNPVDGQRYTYLLGTYEILDPTAIEKIDSGLWKNLSSEVGTWTSNAEAEYWPVYQGVAYVDFPAVEGLKTFASTNGVGSKFSIMSEENAVGTTDTQTGQQGTPQATPPMPPMPPAAAPGGQTVDHAGQQTGTPAAPAQPHLFTVNGQQVSDFAAVQAHITSLESFRTESIQTGRKEFVNGLIVANKMLASNKDEAEKFALMLSDEQFLSYKKQWESAPVLPQLENHAEGTTNHSGTTTPGTSTPPEADELSIAEETVKNFRLGGMSEDKVMQTPSYAKLVAAGKAPAPKA
jgi:hypothetical protein